MPRRSASASTWWVSAFRPPERAFQMTTGLLGRPQPASARAPVARASWPPCSRRSATATTPSTRAGPVNRTPTATSRSTTASVEARGACCAASNDAGASDQRRERGRGDHDQPARKSLDAAAATSRTTPSTRSVSGGGREQAGRAHRSTSSRRLWRRRGRRPQPAAAMSRIWSRTAHQVVELPSRAVVRLLQRGRAARRLRPPPRGWPAAWARRARAQRRGQRRGASRRAWTGSRSRSSGLATMTA